MAALRLLPATAPTTTSTRTRAGAIALLLIALLAALIAPALFTHERADAATLASVDDFTFDSMDVTYELGRTEDGTSTARVTETFVAVFPEYDQNRGMRRAIPTSYLGAPQHPRFISITDGEGNTRESEVETEDGYFSMTSRADDFVHGRQTYVFTYTIENVTRYFADTGVDEFFWNVNGTEWGQPFGQVTARVTMAPELAQARTGNQACYQGYANSTDRCQIGEEGADVVASASGLAPSQTMTIAVGFEPETFSNFDSSVTASPWGWGQMVAALALAGAVVWAFLTRRRYLRDEPGRPTIIAEYTPPSTVDALECAVLLGHTTKAIPAEVLEQAVRGSIRIFEGSKKMFGGVHLVAELVDPSKADGDGRMLLDGLFPSGQPGEQFEFGRTDTRFSTAAQKILKAANEELDRRGLRRPVPASKRLGPILIALLAAVALVICGIGALDSFVRSPIVFILLFLAIPVFLVVIFSLVKKPLTAAGAETRDHLAGLKVFIEWAEADRIRMLQSPQGAERMPVNTADTRQMLHLYETLLPFAVVFGQEKEWSKELAVLYGAGTGPAWYVGTHGFDASSFSSGISTLSASTASSSSTSGGSSGGGSAGGGGGGGGGGGV